MEQKFLNVLIALVTIFTTVSCKDDDTIEDPIKDTEFNTTTIEVDHDDDENTENLTIETVTITDYGNGVGDDFVFISTKEYVLNGRVFINDGQTATIEAGTVIKGLAGQGENTSALIVARGGFLTAEGTVNNPIIMTTAVDETVRYSDGTFVNGSNINANQKGLWGGLVVLGKAGLTNGATSSIEGIPTSESRGKYGGTDDQDNSGTFKYISVRHGGTSISSGNEINGITLGGVGSGTIIDYVEVFANKDDGIEFFGGTARVKHAIVAFCGDDSFDYDEGYRGYGQFWFTVQVPSADRGGEHDGGPSDCQTCTPYATPQIYNATYIGDGTTASSSTITFKEHAGGHYANSIFTNFQKGIDIENLDGTSGDCLNQFMEDNLTIKHNIFYNIGSFTSSEGLLDIINVDSTAGQTMLNNAFASDNNTLTTTSPINDGTIDLSSDNLLDPRASSSEATTAGESEPDTWFTDVSYKGAFSSSDTWHLTWSTLDMRGYFSSSN